MSDKPLTIDERIAIARAPITVGILATAFTTHAPRKTHAGFGAHPTTPVFNEWGRAVGTRAMRVSGGDGE